MIPSIRGAAIVLVSLHSLGCVNSSPVILAATSTSTSSLAIVSPTPTAFTAAPFMTAYSEYYAGFEATQTTVEPQPKVSSWLRGMNFDLNLTDARTIPTANDIDPVVLPPSVNFPNIEAEVFAPGRNFSTLNSTAARVRALTSIGAIIAKAATLNVSTAASNCSACTSALAVAQTLAHDYPWEIQNLLLTLCTRFTSSKTCTRTYSPHEGGIIAQVLSYANVTGLDGILLCMKQVPGKPYCQAPAVAAYNPSDYFNTTEPAANVKVAPVPSGQTPLKVLHLSDFHLDPRYTIGSEALCAGYLCCRPGGNTSMKIVAPAPRFGAFNCDTPYSAAIAALSAIGPLIGGSANFSIFTGDLTSHDSDSALSRAYVEYTETATYDLFKKYLGITYTALGNHDSWPQAQNSLKSMATEYLSDQFSWNYNNVAALWQHNGWISDEEASIARTHYGGYSTLSPAGLRVITINTDFWYNANKFNYINTTSPDPSGTLAFLSSELQRAENKGERVWIIGHVLAGFTASQAMAAPTDLFAKILARYSPHTVAAVFMGHVHEEYVYLNYKTAGLKTAETAQVVTWVGPSVTPLVNLNSGFRMYEVDPVTFSIMESHTWYSNVSTYAALDQQNATGPVWEYEYSARESYGKNVPWPATSPLNATWWHKVTEQMEREPSLVNLLTQHQGRLSPHTTNCTSTACVTAKICYLRAGSQPEAAPCTPGFESVQ